MKVSIITSVYNNEKTTKDAIKSVLSQTYPNIEYKVPDSIEKEIYDKYDL